MCFQLFMVYVLFFFHLGAIIGTLVDAVLPIRPTFLQYWIGCGAVLGIGFSMFGLMQVMGMNPMWSVSLALKWCAQKSWIHLDTTPFSALVKDGAALFGRLEFTQGSTISFCLIDNHLIHLTLPLTHWGRDEMDNSSLTTFSNVFSSKKIFKSRLKFHSLFLRFRAGRHNECCSGLQYQPRQRRPYKWSISILPRSQFTKSKGNLRFRRLVPLFVSIGVCVTTHDDGTASDVTIGMWRHNQQVTNHERNGKPWFSLPK